MNEENPEIEALRSSGIAYLNSPPEVGDGAATIIVMGVSRSGTTMVAACLHECGLPMGRPKLDKAVYEDVGIAQPLEANETEQLDQVIQSRNKAHRLWGFKRPMAFHCIQPHLSRFRNPRLVVTFRDPVAIAKRNEISMHMPFLQALQLANTQTAELISFLQQVDHPTMVVSYEKALTAPRRFATTLFDYCGMKHTPDLLETARKVMHNGPGQYLAASRLKLEGRLESLENGHACGWARQVGQNAPRRILVKHKGKVIGEGLANLQRTDLENSARKGVNCGFNIPLAKESLTLKDVEAEIAGTQFKLRR